MSSTGSPAITSLLNPPDTTSTATPAPTGTPQGLSTSAPPPAPIDTPPAPAPATAPATAPYTAKTYDVTPQMTVAGQIKDIIASGSPLMQQAETAAKNTMNQRGLINSSQAIGAAQDSVYRAATPIAAADAATYAKAASENTAAGNKALEFNAGAENTSQIAKLQSDTTLTAQDMQDKTSALVTDTNAKLQTYLGQLQSNTTLTTQQMASEAQKAISSANNVSSQLIARIQADNSLSISEKNNQSSQIVAQMNNENARTVQQMTNNAALENIRANGEINTQIEKLSEANKNLLQTSSSASQVYSQMLVTMSNIQTNKDLSADQKQVALNNQVTQLNDYLGTLSQISGVPGLSSLLDFGSAPGSASSSVSNSGVAYTDPGGNQYGSNGQYLGAAL